MTPRVEILVSQINKSGAVGVGIHYSLLVAGLEHVLDIYVVLSVPLTVGNFIIPTDELIFFRGVGLKHQPGYMLVMVVWCFYVATIGTLVSDKSLGTVFFTIILLQKRLDISTYTTLILPIIPTAPASVELGSIPVREL